jgi:hypothetical protein
MTLRQGPKDPVFPTLMYIAIQSAQEFIASILLIFIKCVLCKFDFLHIYDGAAPPTLTWNS